MALILLLQVAADSLALALSGWLAWRLRLSGLFLADPYIENAQAYLRLLLLAVVLWHLLLAWRGGWRRSGLLFRLDEMVLHFQTAIQLLVLTMAATFLYHDYDYSRLVVGFTFLLFVVLGSFARQLVRVVRQALHRRGIALAHALLAGNGERRELFERRLRENPGLGVRATSLPAGEDLVARLAVEAFDELYMFSDDIKYENIWVMREQSRNPGLEIHLLPSLAQLYARQLGGGFYDGMVMISLDPPAGRGLTLAAKRLLDLAVAGCFLVLFAPVLLVLALLVRLDSAGPAFFRQTRVGKDGVPFTIFKLRTLHVEAEAYAPTPTAESDPRITRVGRVLRATGLDELPQLYNVATGDMSLVGPRPEMPFIVEKYSDLERKRLKARPGITGLWQLYARTTREPIHSHLEYDLYYIENQSLAMDLMILVDTLPTLLLCTGV